ncbi:sulfotransferase family 2 domain-containing protein [Pseudomonadota bacterium]
MAKKEILGHRNILHYKYANTKKFNDYFKFAVVRNPWNRFASSYFFLLKGGVTDSDKQWGEENRAKYSDFKEFVLSLKNKRNAMRILNWKHFHSQKVSDCRWWKIYPEMCKIVADLYEDDIKQLEYESYY